MQHIAEMLTPELEEAMKMEEDMVKELEQVEQEGNFPWGRPTGCSWRG